MCLNAYGLLDRKIGDLDVFVNEDSKFDITPYLNVCEYEKKMYFTTDFNGETLRRIPLLINGVKVCIFYVPYYLLSAVTMRIEGVEMEIQNPCFAIAGKVLFSKHDPKHIIDLEDIRSKLLNLSLF